MRQFLDLAALQLLAALLASPCASTPIPQSCDVFSAPSHFNGPSAETCPVDKDMGTLIQVARALLDLSRKLVKRNNRACLSQHGPFATLGRNYPRVMLVLLVVMLLVNIPVSVALGSLARYGNDEIQRKTAAKRQALRDEKMDIESALLEKLETLKAKEMQLEQSKDLNEHIELQQDFQEMLADPWLEDWKRRYLQGRAGKIQHLTSVDAVEKEMQKLMELSNAKSVAEMVALQDDEEWKQPDDLQGSRAPFVWPLPLLSRTLRGSAGIVLLISTLLGVSATVCVLSPFAISTVVACSPTEKSSELVAILWFLYAAISLVPAILSVYQLSLTFYYCRKKQLLDRESTKRKTGWRMQMARRSWDASTASHSRSSDGIPQIPPMPEQARLTLDVKRSVSTASSRKPEKQQGSLSTSDQQDKKRSASAGPKKEVPRVESSRDDVFFSMEDETPRKGPDEARSA